MKIFKLFNWFLIAFIAVQFSACENEPLVGEFPSGNEIINVGEGGFIATVDGVGFLDENATATLTSNNMLTLTGVTTDGETIVLTVEEAAVGIFNITAGLGNLNSGVYFDINNPLNPYVSAAAFGGSGVLEITELDVVNLTVTGTFSFTGARIALDADGNPILDSSGNPVQELVEITSGAFNKIVYTLENSGGGTPVANEFFAVVDGVDFIAQGVTTSVNNIAGIPVVKIVAVNADGAIMRIDIPEDLGLGTFAMESLSDGTKLISLYNPNTGGENLTSNPGTITITKFNTTTGIIEATFSFTATDPIGVDPTIAGVTAGAFAIDYIVTPGQTITSFTADVDGVFFNPDSILVTETVFNGVTRFNITVIDSGTNQKMGLFFPTDIMVGTYDMTNNLIDGTEKFGQYSPDFGNTILYRSTPGVLTIVDYDVVAGIIEGTFSFTAADILNQDPTVYEVTNGAFTLELQ